MITATRPTAPCPSLRQSQPVWPTLTWCKLSEMVTDLANEISLCKDLDLSEIRIPDQPVTPVVTEQVDPSEIVGMMNKVSGV